MDVLPPFRLLSPASVAEAVAFAREVPGARFVAGGTGLIPDVRRRIVEPEALIELSRIPGLDRIEAEGGRLRIGAAVTLARLAGPRVEPGDPAVARLAPVIAAAAGTVAGPTHRRAATVGGNLCLDTRCLYYNQSEWWRRGNGYCLKLKGDACHAAPNSTRCYASYSGDLAPALLVLGAEAEVAGADGTRTLPLAEVFHDDGARHLALAPAELLTAVTVRTDAGVRADYAKARVRGSIDFPLAGVAVALRRAGDGLAELRVGVTGAGSRPWLIDGGEALAGRPLDEAALDALDRLVQKAIQPMRTTLTAVNYRRRVVRNLARSLARRLYEAA